MTNTILHGDCIGVMAGLDADSVDFVLTDPPYLVNYRDRSGRSIANDDNDAWLLPAFRQIHRVMKDIDALRQLLRMAYGRRLHDCLANRGPLARRPYRVSQALRFSPPAAPVSA